MIHAGADGGLHDVAATNILGILAWALLGGNAAVYWTRQIIRRISQGNGRR